MIDGSGAFVLFGSKPLCDVGIPLHQMKPEKGYFKRDLTLGWKAWEKVKVHLPNNRFLMAAREMKMTPSYPEGYPREKTAEWVLKIITLIDAEKAALVLAENYEIFKECVGFDFHPFEIVFEIENRNSVFWNKIFDSGNSLTMGLLYGFGKRNALLYHWRDEFEGRRGKIRDCLKNAGCIPFSMANPWPQIEKRGMAALDIPGFVSFEADETLERYNQEKQKIQKLYRGKDLVEITLKRLSE